MDHIREDLQGGVINRKGFYPHLDDSGLMPMDRSTMTI